jgi:hypothetical protein
MRITAAALEVGLSAESEELESSTSELVSPFITASKYLPKIVAMIACDPVLLTKKLNHAKVKATLSP